MWQGWFGSGCGGAEPSFAQTQHGGARAYRAFGNKADRGELRGWTPKARGDWLGSSTASSTVMDSRFASTSAPGGGFDFQPLAPPGWAPPEEDNMIHIASEIAGRGVDLMVDTGAQLSIMTLPMVQRLGITSHIDHTEMGLASGVGVALILGRLRGVRVRMGQVEMAMDFGVLHIKDSFAMLGMDQMQRYRCVLDLDKRVICFGGDLRGVEVPFMSVRPRRGARPVADVEEATCTVL
uniref:Aspartic peptidase DDI1-type domain-containing protein n=1 Tax=Alexandrium monilatum TaxID=311494 RepID=A0A7S4QWE5_9DINO|mmetsp:Transcript_2908/g.9391  ORF Transcript_2908/g.9391 Transcript_2908/m.9391 type:complete len:237 (+) Transcript_2908:61-771(+)